MSAGDPVPVVVHGWTVFAHPLFLAQIEALTQQVRLFFRYHAPSRVIVFAWVNDEDTKRAYESSDDAYRVFRKMLESGHPPDDWNRLLAEARSEGQRLQQFAAGIAP